MPSASSWRSGCPACATFRQARFARRIAVSRAGPTSHLQENRMSRIGRTRAGVFIVLGAVAVLAGSARVARAAEGQMTWAFHVTIAPRWLDPGETESAITPFMVLYALHDALVKPMPAGQTTPSLAEAWTVSPDWKTYDFVLRNGVRFHNGDAVTADDVKFSFERYRGGGAKLLKDKVKEVQVLDARRVRFVMKDPWP